MRSIIPSFHFTLRNAVLIPLGLLFALACACDKNESPRRWEFETMGTIAAFEIHDGGAARDEAAFTAMQERFDRVNTTMSTWDAASELSRLNRAPVDSAVQLSPLLGDCIAQAISIRDRSGGAFAPGAEAMMRLWGFYRRQGHLPSETELDAARATLGAYNYDATARQFRKRQAAASIDLGGIAKGYAVALVASELGDMGVRNALIDLGGNLHCLGSASGQSGWRVGIRDPLDKERYFARVLLKDQAVATSGSYERFVTIDGKRYGHIMNPATGRPAEGLLSATVVGADATLCDGLSTALFVLGPDDAEALLRDEFPDVSAILVLPPVGDSPALVRASAALTDRIAILPDYAEDYVLEFF